MNRIYVITCQFPDGKELIEGFMEEHELAKKTVDLMNIQSKMDNSGMTYFCTPTDKITPVVQLTELGKSIINKF